MIKSNTFTSYPDFNNEYTLCKKEEYVEDHLLKYCEYCKENNDKDHSKMAHIIAERLVQYLKENEVRQYFQHFLEIL